MSSRIADDAARPLERALAFGGQPDESGATLHQPDVEHFLELFQPQRQRGLRDRTGLCGTAEVSLPGNGEQVFKLFDHARSSIVSARSIAECRGRMPCR
jgi:hypothetical protein